MGWRGADGTAHVRGHPPATHQHRLRQLPGQRHRPEHGQPHVRRHHLVLEHERVQRLHLCGVRAERPAPLVHPGARAGRRASQGKGRDQPQVAHHDFDGPPERGVRRVRPREFGLECTLVHREHDSHGVVGDAVPLRPKVLGRVREELPVQAGEGGGGVGGEAGVGEAGAGSSPPPAHAPCPVLQLIQLLA